MRALPDSSRTVRPDPDGLPWDTTIELLAKTVEEVSRLARENPIQIDRPWDKDDDAAGPSTTTTTSKARPATTPPSPTTQPGIHKSPDGGVVVNGMEAMIAFAAGQGHMVRSENGE